MRNSESGVQNSESGIRNAEREIKERIQDCAYIGAAQKLCTEIVHVYGSLRIFAQRLCIYRPGNQIRHKTSRNYLFIIGDSRRFCANFVGCSCICKIIVPIWRAVPVYAKSLCQFGVLSLYMQNHCANLACCLLMCVCLRMQTHPSKGLFLNILFHNNSPAVGIFRGSVLDACNGVIKFLA